jgi:hypothetical protein
MIALQLWQHKPTGARFIVRLMHGIVVAAAGPLTDEELRAAQGDWRIDWTADAAAIEQHRQEYVRVFPQGDTV